MFTHKKSLCLLACFALFANTAVSRAAHNPTGVTSLPTERAPEATYTVLADNDGNVFPALAQFASFQSPIQRSFGIVRVTITNSSSNAFHGLIRVRVPGWSDEEMQNADLPAGEVKEYVFAPTFLPRLFSNREISPATAQVTIGKFGGADFYATTIPLRIRATEDMYWGEHFKNAAFIASWVTPHDSRVEALLSKAKELMPGRRLPGYEPWKSSADQGKETYLQARAIFNALKDKGVSYVKSSTTFGSYPDLTQRIRLPKDTLERNSANCIDAAVMYASAFENLGMEPVIVLIPGHAYVGVRSAQGSSKYLFFDAALTARTSFDEAVLSADNGMAKQPAAEVMQIPIANARKAGIFPMQ